MNKFYICALLLSAGSVFASSTYTDNTSTTYQKPEDQKGFMEKLKEMFSPSRKQESDIARGMTEGPTLGERASATAEAAKVKGKEVAHETKEAVTGSSRVTEGPTLGERASATAESAKVKGKDLMSKIKHAFSSDTTNNSDYSTRTTETTHRPYGQTETGKTWSEKWEDFKERLFGTKRAHSDNPVA